MRRDGQRPGAGARVRSARGGGRARPVPAPVSAPVSAPAPAPVEVRASVLAPAVTAVLLAGGLVLGAGSASATPPVPDPAPPTTAATTTSSTTPPPAEPTPTRPAPTQPAPEATARYVALGDSWAAGTAAGDLDPASGTCRRSRGAYPGLVAQAAGEARWLSRACAAREAGSGNTQFTSLSPEVRAVTATVGADAIGLGELLRACSRAAGPRECDTAAGRSDKALGALPRNLDAAIGELRRGAPRAAVTFVGFPLPAEGAACPAGAADTDRAARADAVVTRLDAILLQRAQAAGVRFVDVRQAFAGHGVCAEQPWLTPWNGAEARLAGGPTAAGHLAGYRPAAANAVLGALAAPADAVLPPTTGPGAASDPGTAPGTPGGGTASGPGSAPAEQRAARPAEPGSALFPG